MIRVGRYVDPDGDFTPVSGTEEGISMAVLVERPTRDEMSAALTQLRGLHTGVVVPVVSECRPELDGLYRIDSVSCNENVGAADADSPVAQRVEISAVRLAVSMARAELVVGALWRPSELTGWPTDPISACAPGHAGAGWGSFEQMSTATGTVQRYWSVIPTGKSGIANRYAVEVTPGEWYDGAATLEAEIGDAGWVELQGREFPAGRRLRLSNGLVRVTFDGGPDEQSTVTWERWNGTAWTDLLAFEAFDWTHPDIASPFDLEIARYGIRGVQVVRNTPEEVSVRLWGDRMLVGPLGQHWRQVWTLRRGMRCVEVADEIVAGRLEASIAGTAVATGGDDYGILWAAKNVAALGIAPSAVHTSSPSSVSSPKGRCGLVAYSGGALDFRDEWYGTLTDATLRIV